MGRGIEGRKIFVNKKDRIDFIARLKHLAEDQSMAIYAWALLDNHFHLLCKTNKRPLSSSMRTLLTGYAVNFNKRHRRHGHLFQNRYKSIVCQEDAYLLELVRYIHLNLLRAGIVKTIDELNRSPFSGHSALTGSVGRDWQDTRYVLSLFGGGSEARNNYIDFVKQGVDQGNRPELVGGGLIRSMGGWFEVLALRSMGIREASDQRILGDGAFVGQVLEEMDDMGRENLRMTPRPMDLACLAEKVCEVHGVILRELRSGSRRAEIVEARRVFSLLAVKELGYAGAAVARYLGVTSSCVTRAASGKEIPQKERYI
jgi:putative transposase